MSLSRKNSTKSQVAIIAAAKSLFWKYGISKVTVEEICERAGVSKMTFYRKFQNKYEVAEKVLAQLAQKGLEDYNEIMKAAVPFNRKIQLLVKMKHDSAENLSEDFIRDVYGAQDPKLKNILEEAQIRSSEAFYKDLIQAQKKGELRKDLKIDFVIYMINSLKEKMLDKNLTSMYSSTQQLADELTNFVFYGIMPKDNK